MKEVEYIVGIYNQFNPFPENPDDLGFYFLYLLDQKGVLDLEEAKLSYKEKYQLTEDSPALKKGLIGPFESIDAINQYSFSLCEKLNAEKISLLSVVDYNSLLEAAPSSLELHQDLVSKGNVITNIERKKKGGFLSKIFNS
jgi:hypothetical protein